MCNIHIVFIYFTLYYLDEDGDDVVVSSDDEVMTALQALNGDVIKLFVYCKQDEAKDDDCDIVFTAVAGNPNGKFVNLVTLVTVILGFVMIY